MPAQPVQSQENKPRQPPAGSNVIFLPGLLNDGRLFASQAVALQQKGIQSQAVTLDFASDIAGLAAGVLDKAPARFSLAALSMGGYVAFEVIRQLQAAGAMPRLEKLILMNTQARPDDAETRQNREALIKLAQLGRFKGVTPRLLPRLIGAAAMNRQEVTSLIMTMAEEMGRDGFVNQQRAILSRPDSRDLLPTLAVPTLLIGGTEDRLTPPAVIEEMAGLLPAAQMQIIPGCGHLSPLEAPQTVAKLLCDFI